MQFYIRAFFAYILLFCWGFYKLKTKTFKLHDFWPNYEPIQKTKSGIIVCNHVSFFDMFMLLLIGENPSFLSKQAVSKIPIVGFFARVQQTIFFSRESQNDRDGIMGILKERVELAEQGKMNPIVIFPEGTTANGRALMSFKKGPFALEKPITVYSLFYNSDFLPCLHLISVPHAFFIFLSTLTNRLTFYRFDRAIDPLWILSSQGVSQTQEPWEQVASEIKSLMCFAFDFEADEIGFREKVQLECQVQGITTQQYYSRQ